MPPAHIMGRHNRSNSISRHGGCVCTSGDCPAGSYTQTCAFCEGATKTGASTLTCKCQFATGAYSAEPSSLDLTDGKCDDAVNPPMDIANCNSSLTCGSCPPRQSLPSWAI